jgi:nucleoside 2-deoxyribosyltransferase
MEKELSIYFAAPLFTQGEWLWNKELGKALRASGLNILLPQESAIEMLNGTDSYDPTKLFRANINDIEKSNVLLAIFDQADPDSGTCWECGFAYSRGIPIIGIRTDLRRAGDDPNASINLMLSKSCKKMIDLPYDKREDLIWLSKEIIEQIKTLI